MVELGTFAAVVAIQGDRAMPSVLPLSVADAKVAEKKAWRRYAEARDEMFAAIRRASSRA